MGNHCDMAHHRVISSGQALGLIEGLLSYVLQQHIYYHCKHKSTKLFEFFSTYFQTTSRCFIWREFDAKWLRATSFAQISRAAVLASTERNAAGPVGAKSTRCSNVHIGIERIFGMNNAFYHFLKTVEN